MRLYEHSLLTFEEVDNYPAAKEILFNTLEEANKGINKAIAKIEAPISRYDVKNGNGRTYSRKLWEKVIAEQKNNYYGSLGFMNHPEKREDMRDVAIVWKNGRIGDDGFVWWEGFFVGPYGETCYDILLNGGKIGLSSVGDGDLDVQGNVIPESYKILRPADIVYDPSQKVFATQSTIKENQEDFMEELRNLEESAKEEEKRLYGELADILECDPTRDSILNQIKRMKDHIIRRG